jgi:hypothetical protein
MSSANIPTSFRGILISKCVFLVCFWAVPQLLWCQGNEALSMSAKPSKSDLPTLKITFITGNEMKAAEMSLILENHGTTKSSDEDQVPLVHLRVVKVELSFLSSTSFCFHASFIYFLFFFYQTLIDFLKLCCCHN